MKNLKMILAATLIVAGTTMVNAQDAKKGSDHAHKAHTPNLKKGKELKKMKEELQLSEEQITQIKAIKEKRTEEKRALKIKLYELEKAEKEEIKTVLTEEQIKKINATPQKGIEHKQRKTKATSEQPVKLNQLKKE